MSPEQSGLGIVVGVDGSRSSTVAVEWAARDAEMRNVALRVVHVVAPIVAEIPAPPESRHRPTMRGGRKTRPARSSRRPTRSPSGPARQTAHRR